MENFIKLEENMNLCGSLIEITRDYCEHHIEKSKELVILCDILGIVLNKQHECLDLLDKTTTFYTK